MCHPSTLESKKRLDLECLFSQGARETSVPSEGSGAPVSSANPRLIAYSCCCCCCCCRCLLQCHAIQRAFNGLVPEELPASLTDVSESGTVLKFLLCGKECRRFPGSIHISSNERYLLGQNTTCEFSGQFSLSSYKRFKQQSNGGKGYKLEWRPQILIWFWLSYVAFLSSACQCLE